MEERVMNEQEMAELMEELGRWGKARDVEDTTKLLARRTRRAVWVESYKSMVGAKAYGKETYWKMADGILKVLELNESLKAEYNKALEEVKG